MTSYNTNDTNTYTKLQWQPSIHFNLPILGQYDVIFNGLYKKLYRRHQDRKRMEINLKTKHYMAWIQSYRHSEGKEKFMSDVHYSLAI